MFPFSQSVTPAVRHHLDAQVSFMNDFSRSLSRSLQQMCELNMQLGQTMLEETSIAGHQLLTTENPTDAIAVTASRAQPATEKLRAYQQHISRVVADAQVDLSRVTEQHVQETSRTARDLAEQVARTAKDDTERSLREQEKTMRSFRDPFADRAGTSNGSANVQVDIDTGGQHAGFQGNVHSQPSHNGKGAAKPN